MLRYNVSARVNNTSYMKGGNVLFNDALISFYLRLYGVGRHI